MSNVIGLLVNEKKYDMEDWYGKWYECPKCESKDVRGKANYCDNCGQKLEYKPSCIKST